MRKENSTNSEGKDRQFDWFYMMPYDIEEIIQYCELSKQHWKEYAMDYLGIMKMFCRKQTRHGDIRLSVLRGAMKLKNYKVFDSIIDCKWLFYKYPVGEYRKDFIIQPVFDTSRLTPLQYSQAVEALRDGDYQELTRIIPFRVRPELKKQELLNYDTNGDATASIPNTTSISFQLSNKEGSDREAAAPQTESVKITNYPMADPTIGSTADPTADTTISSTADPTADTTTGTTAGSRNIMYACLDKRQETRDKRQDIISHHQQNYSGSVEGEQKGALLLLKNKNSDLKASLEKFFNGLTPESDDGQRILGAAGDYRRFYADNFSKLKQALIEHGVKQNKPEDTRDPRLVVRYFCYCLEHKRVRQKIFDRVEQLARSNNKFHVSTDPRYPFDVLNEQGLRVSEGKVIPQDAPPKPDRTSVWDNGRWISA